MANKNANGTGDLLTKAMKQVFSEVFDEKIDPVMELMGEVKTEMGEVKEEVAAVNTRLDSHQKALDGIKNRKSAR